MLRFKRHEFRPGLWPSIATLLVFPLLLSLGFWQLDRAGQKAEMQADFQARYQLPRVLLNQQDRLEKLAEWRWREVTIRGRYADTSYLLDNQVHAGDAGYRLYTPLRLAGTDKAVLVERDWLPLGPNRQHVPAYETADGLLSLQGRIVPPPATGIMLGEHRLEALTPDSYRVQRIKPDELAQHSDLALLPYVIRLHDAAHAADDEKAALGGFGRERHLGYAFQWFALAATLLVIYIWVNLKRRIKEDE